MEETLMFNVDTSDKTRKYLKYVLFVCCSCKEW